MKQKNYTWQHLYNSSSAKIAKFRCIERCGVPQSEWCFELWGRTNEAIAPPMGGCYNV